MILKLRTIPPIEKTHLKFCKRYLEISNKASNVASRSELRRLPLIINICKNIFHYMLYLLRKNEDTILKPLQYCNSYSHANKAYVVVVVDRCKLPFLFLRPPLSSLLSRVYFLRYSPNGELACRLNFNALF